ncbi:hypothetical protein M0804_013754 [Polistes exclamans]|nr:hypothetical protein M0804_013754 [Polistes exclamans]
MHVLVHAELRASLVLAAAVIPAPIAYIKVVAVKKLVVVSVFHTVGSPLAVFTGMMWDVLPVGLALRGGPTNIPSRCSSLSFEMGRVRQCLGTADVVEKMTKLDHLEEVKDVTRFLLVNLQKGH